MSALRVLVVDNRDSFVHTLAGYLSDLGAHVRTVDAATPNLSGDVAHVDAVVVSPGPGHPVEAGESIAVVHAAHAAGVPLLGVCLGHQAIGVAFGATVGPAPELLHGITSTIRHSGRGPFAGMPDGFSATRYHSLAIETDTVPAELEVIARTDGGVIMGIAHRDAPIVGVQFHPESILTEGGHRLLGRWLEDAGLPGAARRGALLHPRGVTNPSRT